MLDFWPDTETGENASGRPRLPSAGPRRWGCAASTKSAGKRSLLGAPTIYLRGPAIAVTPSGPEDERQTRDAAWEKASGPDLGCPG